MNTFNSAVVASLRERSSHPLSSVSLSPSKKLGVIAGKDTLQVVSISPEGIQSLRSLKISQHFQATVSSTERRSPAGKTYGDVRDTFNLVSKQQGHSGASMTHGNVIVTCVAWSNIQSERSQDGGDNKPTPLEEEEKTNTIIAAAGSNGVVVVWSSASFVPDTTSHGSSTLTNQQPEGILNQHSRAINSLAWHPKRPGLLLTASQDATVKLWERIEITNKADLESKKKRKSWFNNKAHDRDAKYYQWACKSTFEPKSEGVRDIQWSKFQDDGK